MASLVGRTLAHYRIHSLLGEGGMGAVYRAEDTKLGREVALKVLPDDVATDPDRLSRFRREARAVAALNHPNIVTVHSVEEADSVHFLTMELVEGETLDERIPDGGMSLEAFLGVAEPLAEALVAAHASGIVHRDIKTANVMVTTDGRTKVLDFGLARMDADASDATQPTQTATQFGAVIGTPAYMSPEQARGLQADARSDIFSTGVVFYEMLTGERPFRRADGPSTIHAILHDTPQAVSGVRKGIPADLARLVARCLEKDPAGRFPSAEELRTALAACRSKQEGSSVTLARWQIVVPALVLLVAVGVVGVGWVKRSATARRVRTETIPRIEALIDEGQPFEAFVLARQALEAEPDDPLLQRLLERSSWPGSVTTDPPGAAVAFQAYGNLDAAWHPLGTSPIEGARVPDVYLTYRVELPGYETATFGNGRLKVDVELVPAGTAPAGMVRVPAGDVQIGTKATPLPAFWLGRYEVTNREYLEFVTAGGYSDPRYWPGPFVDGGRTLSRDEALARFVDATGRPGPAGWELGQPAAGNGELPVTGVSWYEAAAFASWAGRSLPTIYHWYRAAEANIFADILVYSNFESAGPAPVGSHAGIGPYGNFDMAGNVKEWCHNAFGTDRYSLGGGWDESAYRFDDPDARSPFDRGPSQGFRLASYDDPPDAALLEPAEHKRYDFNGIDVVDDEVYAIYASLYAYEPGELDARVEAVDDASTYWRRETISVTPAYGGTRLLVHVFLPKNATPPYQTVVFRPSSVVYRLNRIEDYASLPDYIPRSGRALVIPALFGSLGRQPERRNPSPQASRERVIRQVQDYRRAIDYLETRGDIDLERLAYGGLSSGGEYGPVYLALEDRVKVAVLISGGFHDEHMLDELPEMNPWNFSSRVTVPTLIINGENDFTLPYETAQKPFFDMLGTPAEHKRLVTIEGGHVTTDRNALIRESLAWYDRYLGPVATQAVDR